MLLLDYLYFIFNHQQFSKFKLIAMLIQWTKINMVCSQPRTHFHNFISIIFTRTPFFTHLALHPIMKLIANIKKTNSVETEEIVVSKMMLLSQNEMQITMNDLSMTPFSQMV